MEGGITDDARSTMLRAALARVGREEMKAGLASTAEPRFAAPKAVRNALNALQKQKDPVVAVLRTPYRAAVPYLAAAIADDCLSRTVEELGTRRTTRPESSYSPPSTGSTTRTPTPLSR